LTVNLLVLF